MPLLGKVKSILVLAAITLASVNVSAVNPYDSSAQDHPAIIVYKENHGTLRGLEMRTIWQAQLNSIIAKNKITKKPEIIDVAIVSGQEHISFYPLQLYVARINCVTPAKSYLYEGFDKNNSITMKNAMALDSTHYFYIERKAVEGIFSAYCK